MAFAKHTLILVLVFAFLLLLTECSNTDSNKDKGKDKGKGKNAPSPAPTKEDKKSSPTPSPPKEEEEDDENDEEDSAPSPSSEAAADSPLSINELFELSLPEIGVQKVVNGPVASGAKVTNKQLEGIEHKIEEFKPVLAKRIANPGSAQTKKCYQQCQENLDDAIDGVKQSIESIKNKDLSKANIDISGVATDIETCNDCFVDAGEADKDINAFNLWIKGVTKECLANLKKT